MFLLFDSYFTYSFLVVLVCVYGMLIVVRGRVKKLVAFAQNFFSTGDILMKVVGNTGSYFLFKLVLTFSTWQEQFVCYQWWKMSCPLQVASKLEIRAVTRFLWAKKYNPTEIHRHLNEVYGNKAISRQAIAKWYALFENGRTNIEDDFRQGRPWTSTTNDNVERVNELIRANRRVRRWRNPKCDVRMVIARWTAIFRKRNGKTRSTLR